MTPEPSAAPVDGGKPMAVVIKSASIEGGTLIYRDLAAGTEQKVENLNIDLSLDSLTGPFQAEGGATVANIPLGFRVKTGALDPTKPMPLDVSFTLSDANASIGFVGQVDLAAVEDPSKPIVTGKLSSKGENLAKMIAGMPNQSADGLPPIMAQAFAVDADIQAGKTNARTDNFTANLGDLSAKASVAANYETAPSVQANVALGRIDLDKLMPAGEAKQEAAEAPAESTPAQPAAPFSLPPDVTADLGMTVEQIVYKGQAIEGTDVKVQLANGTLTIKNASAKLPGSSNVALNGALTAQNGQPNFDGALKADSSNLRALIEAFAPGAVKDVPGDRLLKFALNTGVKYNPAQAELSGLKATLDQSNLTGGVVVALPDGVQRKQIGLGVGLSVDKLNLDNYMPAKSAQGGGAGGNRREEGAGRQSAESAGAACRLQRQCRFQGRLADLERAADQRPAPAGVGRQRRARRQGAERRRLPGRQGQRLRQGHRPQGRPEVRFQVRRDGEGCRPRAADGRHGPAAQGQVRRADAEGHGGRHADRRHL